MKTMNTAHQACKAVQSTRRSVLAAAAITTLLASSPAMTWAAAVEPLSQVGASLPVAQFDIGAMPAANTWSRASGFASVLVGEELRTLHSKVRVPSRTGAIPGRIAQWRALPGRSDSRAECGLD